MSYTNGLDKPSNYFLTKLYTGNGGTLVNTGVNFRPDLVWIKSRTQANSHVWFDAIRTFAGGKEIQSNNTGSEGASDSAGYGYISAVSSDGFTAQAGTTAGDYTNVSSQNYVAWNWLASNTTASNSNGSITSTVSANTTSGFSIVSYTGNVTSGATVGHGLGTTPAVIIVKKRSGSDGWVVYHHRNTSAPETEYLRLDTTTATADNLGEWNDTAPSPTVFTIGNSGRTNDNGATYIAYCFAEKKGFSKFGSYTGNGNADGTFVYTGFKPAWVMVKRYDGTGQGWNIWDNKRDTFNLVDEFLIANSSNAEATGSALNLDFLSNGFKFRGTDGGSNTSGSEYVYMAFAESPFVTSSGVPATAR